MVRRSLAAGVLGGGGPGDRAGMERVAGSAGVADDKDVECRHARPASGLAGVVDPGSME